MYKYNETSEPLDEQTILWKYMDFAKFINMIETKSLYFCRCDLLDDNFEGVYPILTGKEPSSTYDKESLLFLKSFNIQLRKRIYINCWHINNDESFAMWKVFNEKGQGIAIKVQNENLVALLDADREKKVLGGKVKYIDYSNVPKGFKSYYDFTLLKRKSFEYEKEFRLIIQLIKSKEIEGGHKEWDFSDDKNLVNGISLEVDITKLVNQIYVSPQSPDWYFEIVKNVIKKYGIEMVPIRSSLDDKTLL